MRQSYIDLRRWIKQPRLADNQQIAQNQEAEQSESHQSQQICRTQSQQRDAEENGSDCKSQEASQRSNVSLDEQLPKFDKVGQQTDKKLTGKDSTGLRPSQSLQSSFDNSSFAGSQRVVRNGERMVTNSDEDEDSSSSLADIDELLRGSGDASSPKAPTKYAPDVPKAADPFILPDRPRPEKKRKYRYSLSYLAEQQKKHKQSTQAVEKTNALILSAAERQSRGKINDRPSELLIDSMMGNEEEENGRERLKKALRSTEALHQKYRWSFFTISADVSTKEMHPPPAEGDPTLQRMLSDPSIREQAFLSGFVDEYISKKAVSEEHLLWLLGEAIQEDREDLRSAYLRTLATAGPQVGPLITAPFLEETLRRFGASNGAIDLQHQIMPTTVRGEQKETSIPNVKIIAVMNLLAGVSDYLVDLVRDLALHLICRFLLDYSFIANCRLTLAAQATIACLAKSTLGTGSDIRDAQDSVQGPRGQFSVLVESIRSTLKEPSLRLQLLNYLPVHNPQAASLRRNLAAAFVFEESEAIILHMEPTIASGAISELLSKPRFGIDKSTNYSNLAAWFAMLNICIDTGDLSQDHSELERGNFDQKVDRIATRLRDLAAQIVETGPLNMGRTEAKEIIDSLHRRLSYSIRTEPPPKQTILRDRSDTFEVERATMKEWVKSAKEHATGVNGRIYEDIESH